MYISRRFSLKPIHWPPANHGSALQIYLSFCKWSLEHPWTSFLVLKTSQNPRDSRLSGNPGAVTKKTKEALIKTQDSLEELWDSRHQPGISERKWTTEGVQWGFLHKMPPPEVGTGLDQFGTYDGTMGTMGPWKKKTKKTRVGRLYYQHTWLQVSNGDHPKLFSQGRSHGRFDWSQMKPAKLANMTTLGGWIRSIAMHSWGASP